MLQFVCCFCCFFFFNDTATTEIYTLSLHDALPIYDSTGRSRNPWEGCPRHQKRRRSEEHTSELQSPCNLVCRLLLEKKKTTYRERNIRENHGAVSAHADRITGA